MNVERKEGKFPRLSTSMCRGQENKEGPAKENKGKLIGKRTEREMGVSET